MLSSIWVSLSHQGLAAETVTEIKSRYTFIENKGQWAEDVQFMTEIPGGRLYLKNDGLHYALIDNGHYHGSAGAPVKPKRSEELKVKFLNTSNKGYWSASQTVETVYNFYHGNNPNEWGEGCHGFGEVRYHDIYEGVDLVFYQESGQLKYDFILAPGISYSNISWEYQTNKKVYMDGGCVGIKTAYADILEGQPLSYQEDYKGNRHYIESYYSLKDNVVQFDIPQTLDDSKPLVIDPALIFSTFSGSISDNWGYTACYDEAGNLYSGGIVFGENFPSSTIQDFEGSIFDMAILKYDSSGSTLQYATFLGGTGADTPQSLVVNNNNELVLLGTTGSVDFPVSTTAYDRIFNGGRPFQISGVELYPNGSDLVIAKLAEDGRLLRGTYMGGNGNDGILRMLAINFYENSLIQNYGDYQRGDVFTDEEGNIYVASNTDSSGFPVTSRHQSDYAGGASDAVVFSLDENLSTLRWSTLLGGAGDDAAYSIKLDDQNRVYVGGGTSSDTLVEGFSGDILPYQGSIDGFIAAFDIEEDSLVYFTYMGTSAYDQVYFIDIDTEQNVYAFGQTRGDYPITPGSFAVPNSGQFIHKLTPDLQSTIFSTVFGSGTPEPNISPTAFLANECENIFLSGWGGTINNIQSSNNGNTFGMPVTDDALFPETDGSDFYLMALSADGRELLFATFFGGTANEFEEDSEDHVDGGTSRFDKRGIMYQAVCSCGGDNDSFPVTENAWSEVNLGVNANGTPRCNNAAFKYDLASLRARFTTNTPEEDFPGVERGCAPFTVLLTNTSIGGEEFSWEVSDGANSEEPESWIHTFESPGTYTITLTIRDENTCKGVDSTTRQILVFDDDITVSPDVSICRGESVTLNASGGVVYAWSPAIGMSDSTAANPTVTPLLSTDYVVQVTTVNGCVNKDTVSVEVKSVIQEEFTMESINEDCTSPPVFVFENLTPSEDQVVWNFGDGTQSTEANPTHQYLENGTYVVSIESPGDCIIDNELVIDYKELFIPNAFSPNGDGINEFFEIQSNEPVSLSIVDRTGVEQYTSEVYQNDWSGDNLAAGTYFYQVQLNDGATCEGWVQLLK